MTLVWVMAEMKDRIREAREARNLKQTELAGELGVSRNAISLWESGRSVPGAATGGKLAVLLDVSYDWLRTGRGTKSGKPEGLRILGTIAAATWTEVREEPELEYVPVMPSTRYPPQAQYALRVVGTSIDKVAPPGAILTFVDIYEVGMEPPNGALVHVERRRGDLVETTVKQLRQEGKARELWPLSTDPRHQAKIPLKSSKLDEIEIKGVVIGVYRDIPITGV